MADDNTPPAPDTAVRKRPKPGERRIQILQALAAMLEQPGAERVTTAALAARLQVSEAALYRHFASKAQMFEGLIEFIETSVFSLLNQIAEGPHAPLDKVRRMITVLLQFAERNPGMARVMVGDALVFENDRLHQRMNLFFDKVEARCCVTLRRHSLRPRPAWMPKCRPRCGCRSWWVVCSALPARATSAHPWSIWTPAWPCSHDRANLPGHELVLTVAIQLALAGLP